MIIARDKKGRSRAKKYRFAEWTGEIEYWCNQCSEYLTKDKFYKQSGHKQGIASACKKCSEARRKTRPTTNPTKAMLFERIERLEKRNRSLVNTINHVRSTYE